MDLQETINITEKKERIKAEITKLNKICKEIDKDKKRVVQKLIENVAFMAVSLEDLQQQINSKGFVEVYQNGANQSGFKECTEIKIYNALIKNYNASLKQLIDMLPEQTEQKQDYNDLFK